MQKILNTILIIGAILSAGSVAMDYIAVILIRNTRWQQCIRASQDKQITESEILSYISQGSEIQVYILIYYTFYLQEVQTCHPCISDFKKETELQLCIPLLY